MRAILFLLCVFLNSAATMAEETRDSLVSESPKPLINTNTLHDKMSIRSRYLPGGQFYLSGFTNTFGEDEPLNTNDQVIYCDGSERSFTDTIVSLIGQEDPPEDGAVRYDSASFGVNQNQFVGAMENALQVNATNNARGRFCLERFNPDVTYRDGSIDDNICEAGQDLSFTDPYSGYSCKVTLDTDLKAGSYRFLRSEFIAPPSVGLGYAKCNGEGYGPATLELVSNPPSCKDSPETCVNTCTWTGNNICRGSELPRWGGGRCGGQGTQSILDDVISVDSVDSYSIDMKTGRLYRGTARFICAPVVEGVQWQILSENCSAVSD